MYLPFFDFLFHDCETGRLRPFARKRALRRIYCEKRTGLELLCGERKNFRVLVERARRNELRDYADYVNDIAGARRSCL